MMKKNKKKNKKGRKEEILIFHHECLIRGMKKWKGEKWLLSFLVWYGEKDEA